MKLTLFNGSPRGTKSNTKILTDLFISGIKSTAPNTDINTAYLVRTNETEKFNDLFLQSDTIIIAFPLYVDAIPGIVKHFIEQLEPIRNRLDDKRIGFIVHSGFPESIHSRFVEKYLEKLTRRLNCHYLGTIIKGGTEGIQSQPPRMTKKLFDHFTTLGKLFGQNNVFDETIKKQLSKLETLSKPIVLILKILSKTPVMNFYWNQMLKKNKAYKNRYAQPFKR